MGGRRGPWESHEPFPTFHPTPPHPRALGPGCRTSGLLLSPGALTTIPDGGEGEAEPPAAEGRSCVGLGR